MMIPIVSKCIENFKRGSFEEIFRFFFCLLMFSMRNYFFAAKSKRFLMSLVLIVVDRIERSVALFLLWF